MNGAHPMTFRLLWALARPRRRLLFVGLLATLGVVALRLAIPWPLRALMEATVGHSWKGRLLLHWLPHSHDPSLFLCFAYVAISIGTGLASMVQRVRMSQFAAALADQIRWRGLRGIAQRYRSVRASTDDVTARLVGDSAQLKKDLNAILVHLTKDALLFFSVVGLFLIISPSMAIYFLVGGVLAGWVGYHSAAPLERVAERSREREAAMVSVLHQAKEYGQLTADDANGDDDAEHEARSARITASSGVLVHALLGVTISLAIWTGAQQVKAGQLAHGELFLFMAYALLVHRRLVRIGQQLTRFGKIRAAMGRLGILLETPSPALLASASAPARFPVGDLSLEEVQLDAERGSRPRVAPLSLRIEAGTRVAVLGRVGDGKSSLLRCLAGWELPSSGVISWSGHVVNPLDPAFIASVGYLPQDPVFALTRTWKFLGLSAETLTPSQCNILSDFGAMDVIESFPKRLSQKICSPLLSRNEARALQLGALALGDASLWIVDSPFEGLSNEAARTRLKAIFGHGNKRTIVVSLQHLYDPESFHRVLVIRRGKIRFDGSPAEWKAWKKEKGTEGVAQCNA